MNKVLLNVGLEREGKENLTREDIFYMLPVDDIEIYEIKLMFKKHIPDEYKKFFDNVTAIVELHKPLTNHEMKILLARTSQEAIPQWDGQTGKMYGSKRWGEFNAKYFLTLEGHFLSSVLRDDKEKLLRYRIGRKTKNRYELRQSKYGYVIYVNGDIVNVKTVYNRATIEFTNLLEAERPTKDRLESIYRVMQAVTGEAWVHEANNLVKIANDETVENHIRDRVHMIYADRNNIPRDFINMTLGLLVESLED